MTHQEEPFEKARDRFIATRWREYEGESRAALLRSVMVLGFYAIQLIHYLFFSDRSSVEQEFHWQVTSLALVGLLTSLGVLTALVRGFFPWWIKFAMTAFDLILVTLVAWIGNGPQSAMVLIYLLVLGMASLRFHLGLLWFATIGAMLGYMLLVGAKDEHWFDSEHHTKLIDQGMTLGAMIGMAAVLGQMIRISLRTQARGDVK